MTRMLLWRRQNPAPLEVRVQLDTRDFDDLAALAIEARVTVEEMATQILTSDLIRRRMFASRTGGRR